MYNGAMSMRHIPLAMLAICLLAGQVAWAQSPDLINEDRDMVRVMRRPDGSRTVYKRQAGMRGMRCATYLPNGKLAVIHDYTEGRYGQLMGCVVYANSSAGANNLQPIYKVSYGYDNQARLIEERMYSHPEGKLVQRVIYRYDANGNRSKPLIISLNSEIKTITPTLSDDVANTHQQLRNNRRR